MSGMFEGQRAVVIGLGKSGHAAARVLVEEGADVRVTEERRRQLLDDVSEVEDIGVKLLDGGHEPEHLAGATLVVVSPGVPESARILGWARRREVPLWSELELGARLCRVPYVAITGTNGKTTTVEMVASAMRAGGLDAIACGNVGHPFSLAAREGHQALAVEASSFQLRFHQTFHPKVSILLNLADDHLDWHGTPEDYAEAKARIFELQEGEDVHVGDRDDESAAAMSERARCRIVWFRLGEPDEDEVGYGADGGLVSRIGDEVSLGGPVDGSSGFRADAAAAAAAGIAFGLGPEAVGKGVRDIGPLPHRGEVVARAGGIMFVDDSKATNPHAALSALEGRHDVVLIAGGLSKGVDLTPLRAAAPALAGVVAIGEAAPLLEEIFREEVPLRRAGSMEDAVRAAFELAPEGGTVLLAPACASQDMFRDYKERGDRFASAAREIADGHEGGEDGG